MEKKLLLILAFLTTVCCTKFIGAGHPSSKAHITIKSTVSHALTNIITQHINQSDLNINNAEKIVISLHTLTIKKSPTLYNRTRAISSTTNKSILEFEIIRNEKSLLKSSVIAQTNIINNSNEVLSNQYFNNQTSVESYHDLAIALTHQAKIVLS